MIFLLVMSSAFIKWHSSVMKDFPFVLFIFVLLMLVHGFLKLVGYTLSCCHNEISL